MIISLIFVCFFIGLAFKKSIIPIGIILIVLLIKTLSSNKKLSLMVIGVFLLGVGVSFIDINYPNKNNYTGIVYEVKDNYFLYNSNGEKLYCYEKNHPYEVGDIIQIKGYKNKIDFVTLESDFDFNEYLKNKGVNYELEINKVTFKFKNPIRLKSFRNYFLNKFDESAKISLGSILFSDRDENELTNIVSSLHLSRLISASGLYFNALISVFVFILEKKLNNKWAKLIALGASSFYIILTFPRFSIIRLTVIYLFKWINEHILKKRFSYLEVISISGIIFLILNYHLAYQISFILGYSITFYLFIINNSFIKLKKFKAKIFMILALYLFFIPFEISFYNSVSPISIIYQILLSPLFILFFLVGIICLYGIPIYGVANFFNRILINVIKPFNKLSIEIFAPKMNGISLLIYYVILLGLFYYASIGFKPIKRIFIGVYLSSLALYFLPIKNMVTNEVSFINVGQGDCCFIRNKNISIFIDTGGLTYKNLANDCLIPYLKKKRVYNIDLVITTHNDYDHYGALSFLKENFKVKKVMTNTSFTPIQYGNLKFTNYNNHINSQVDENNKSLVIGFNLGNKDYLITGDAPKEIENYIMNEYKYIPCDILKVGHHGSSTSTSDEFVKWLNPDIGVISCGKNNKYGHPNQSVLNILKANNVTIRRTDLEGTISFINWSF